MFFLPNLGDVCVMFGGNDVLLISTWLAIQALRAWNACFAGLWQVDLTHHGDEAQHCDDALHLRHSLVRLHEVWGSLIKFL